MNRIYDNGIYRDMTPEELTHIDEIQPAEDEITQAERIEALEAAVIELAGVILNG